MTLREVDRAKLIVAVFNSCEGIIEDVQDRYLEINGKPLTVFASMRLNRFAKNFGTIRQYPELLVDKYYCFLDGNIQRLIPSNVDEMFLIGYEILVSKGVITRT